MNELKVRTLLVVDDEPMMLELLSNFLLPMGIAVIQALDTNEALAALSSRNITAVLSDVRMPGFSGLDLLEKVRATGNNIPFAFLTASDEKANLHRALQLGATDFLEKPFDADVLKEVIFKLLEIGVKQQELEFLRYRGDEVSGDGEGNNNSSHSHKKSRLINLLRIKLPWRKSG